MYKHILGVAKDMLVRFRGVSKHSFVSEISVRKRHVSQSGALEATGLSMGSRWYLRERSNHKKRLTVLVDAEVVVGSAAKGRTSAPITKLEIRRLDALLVAGGLLVRLVYVPSEIKLADAPSCGVLRSASRKRNVVGATRLVRFRCDDKDVKRVLGLQAVVRIGRKFPGCGALQVDHPKHVP